MSFATSALNDALAGVVDVATHLSLHESDPGTTGAGVDVDVVLLSANWGTPAGASVDSSQVGFAITEGGGSRTYTHFGVWTGVDTSTATFKAGGPLDQSETFSDNGGTYNFTATLTAAPAA